MRPHCLKQPMLVVNDSLMHCMQTSSIFTVLKKDNELFLCKKEKKNR